MFDESYNNAASEIPGLNDELPPGVPAAMKGSPLDPNQPQITEPTTLDAQNQNQSQVELAQMLNGDVLAVETRSQQFPSHFSTLQKNGSIKQEGASLPRAAGISKSVLQNEPVLSSPYLISQIEQYPVLSSIQMAESGGELGLTHVQETPPTVMRPNTTNLCQHVQIPVPASDGQSQGSR